MKLEFCVALLAGVVLCTGCSEESGSKPAASMPKISVDSSKYLLDEAPADAEQVIAVHEASQDGDEVTVVGRIGGSENPWNEGRAIFSIVDNSLKACSDIDGDTCKTPWDYCCVASETLKHATALVKVVDDQGAPLKADARQLLKVKELSKVVVKGTAKRDDAGNLTVLASGIYVLQE